MITPLQNEQLRSAVAAYLAPRHPLKFAPAAIAMQIKTQTLVDFTPSPDDVDRACHFLAELGLVESFTAPLGSSLYYGATAACVLRHERGEL